MFRNWRLTSLFVMLLLLSSALSLSAQSAGSAGSVTGSVGDLTGAVIPGATVSIGNPVSGFERETQVSAGGHYTFDNVPYNHYHLTVHAQGFAPQAKDVEVRTGIPVVLDWKLAIASSSTTVTVSSDAGDLLENTPVGHTDIDRGLFSKIPLESASSSLSSLVTLASPGVAADSNGLFHGMGDHASNSFSVDGQPITDQQSKVFSNQIPVDAVQSLEVIPGAPPAEYGDKTSLVIVATTRSGQNMTRPHGEVTTSYGTFGSSNLGFNVGYGGSNWGNFLSANGMNTGRFLDPPEFVVLHDKGNEENLFDRIDYQLTPRDSLRFNLGYTRSWFQTPNSYDMQYATQWTNGIGPNGKVVGPADQRSKIETVNFAPTYTHLLDAFTVFNFGGWIRRDGYNYFPSGNPFADRGPSNLQQETISQFRTLANTGARADITRAKGINTIKAGVTYEQTFLTEKDAFGIVDPTLVPGLGCTDPVTGAPEPGTPCATLAPYDLTTGGSLYDFNGHADVKELSMYIQDAISAGPWTANIGIRGDMYNGLTVARQAEPRLGVSYKVAPSNTVLRVSYARTLETPFNENLVLSSEGCNSAVIAALIPCVNAPMQPGYRNEFHAGFQQALGHFAVFSGDYVWKYTHTAFDFSVLGATPITFPIGWYSSKIPGFDGRLSVPDFHGLSALVVFSSVAARFYTPQTSGLGVVPETSGPGEHTPFRIDHDERFNQTTHLQYQPIKRGPWMGFNWRYDSGLVAGAVPFATDSTTPVDLTGLTADQQMQAGLFCGGARPTLSAPLTSCAPSQYGSTLLKIPAPGTENDDKNPQRVAPRSLFDLSVGDDNLFRSHGAKAISARLTVVNLANKYALYNFLSTFSGTHYVTPRTVTAQVSFHF